MQAPANLDLTVYQGASWDYSLTWNLSGTPVNLTGYSARMQIRPTYDSSTVVLGLTSGTGITLGGTAGTIYLEASAATTAGFATENTPQEQYVYDLELVSPAGVVTRLVQGRVFIDPEVTR